MDPRVTEAVLSISRDCERPLPVEALARRSGLSPTRFSHLFRKETGTSPGRMLKAVRMQKARELLKNPHYSVKQVMSRVGISDKNHFRRYFKSAFGMTPSEFRRKYIEEEDLGE